MRKPKSWVALLMAILCVFAACKGETPTAPDTGGGNGGSGGGNTPPVGASVVLTASNTTPRTNGTVVITATVTQNGQPVPNGTAVQFTATDGEFTDTETAATIRTTTNGVATASLTSDSAGPIRVTATVNNVVRTIDITFSDEPACVPPDPRCPVSTAPTITSVSPGLGRPSGGETITITGTNFRAPVRVLFDLGDRTVEAFVSSVTPTQIVVVTPSVTLGTGQELVADIIVLTEAGTATEQRVERTGAFTFRSTSLTPVVYSLTPASGPINGGTRVTIIGEGFQAPVQVFFGFAEAKVVEVNFSQIIVQAPDGRSTSQDGSQTVVGPVTVEVINMASNTRGGSPTPFRYLNKLDITGFRPLSGPSTGGTDITIDGLFDAPVDVRMITPIGNFPLTVLRVSGTQLLVRTTPLPSACADVGATIVVRNIENDDFDIHGDDTEEESNFRFIGVDPLIMSVIDTVTDVGFPVGTILPGEPIVVTVDDPGTGPLGVGNIRFQIAGRTVIPSPNQVTDPSTPRGFTFAVPTTGITFPTVTCDVGGFPGTRRGPAEVAVTFLNETTGCTDSVTIEVTPPNPNPCVLPAAQAAVQNPATTACPGLAYGSIAVAGGTSTQNITIRNSAPAGSQNLTINDAFSDNPEFTVSAALVFPLSLPPGATTNIPVTFDPAVAGNRSGFVRVTTNDPARPTIDVCVTGTGTP